jgi:hypothetical protein
MAVAALPKATAAFSLCLADLVHSTKSVRRGAEDFEMRFSAFRRESPMESLEAKFEGCDEPRG